MTNFKAEAIVHEDGRYHVRIDARGKTYEVFRQEATSAVRCAIIGLSLGIERVKAEIARRKANDAARAS